MKRKLEIRLISIDLVSYSKAEVPHAAGIFLHLQGGPAQLSAAHRGGIYLRLHEDSRGRHAVMALTL